MANPREILFFLFLCTVFLLLFRKIRVRSEESEKSHSSLQTILLLSQTELGNDCTIALDINLLKVAQKVLSVADHLLETAAAVRVVVVVLEVLGKVLDSVSQECNLNLGRTCVALVSLVLVDNCLFGFCVHTVFTFLLLRETQTSVGEARKAADSETRVYVLWYYITFFFICKEFFAFLW